MANEFIAVPRPDPSMLGEGADRLYRVLYGMWENDNWLKENAGGKAISSITKSGTTVTVTYTDTTTDTFTVADGTKGDKGDKGDTGDEGPQGLPGENYDKWFPFSYGFAYDSRKTSPPVTSGGGDWQAVGYDETNDDFDDVTRLRFSERDAEGIGRREYYETETLQTYPRLIGIRRDIGTAHHVIAFKTTSAFSMIQRSGQWYAQVNVERQSTEDIGTISNIVPPEDTEYDLHLVLGRLVKNLTLTGSRTPGWFYREVSASIKTAMDALTDPNADNWTGSIATEANTATPGDNIITDIVTLYRGGTSQTRTWDGTNWVAYSSIINGNLLVPGSIIADLIAANAITTDKLDANAVTADKVAAETITGNKVAANTLTADRLLLGDGVEANDNERLVVVAGDNSLVVNEEGVIVNQLNADKITAGTIRADRLEANTFAVRMLFHSINGVSLSTTGKTFTLIENVKDYDSFMLQGSNATEHFQIGYRTHDITNGSDLALEKGISVRSTATATELLVKGDSATEVVTIFGLTDPTVDVPLFSLVFPSVWERVGNSMYEWSSNTVDSCLVLVIGAGGGEDGAGGNSSITYDSTTTTAAGGAAENRSDFQYGGGNYGSLGIGRLQNQGGENGELKLVELTGISQSDELTMVVGAGGSGRGQYEGPYEYRYFGVGRVLIVGHAG